MPKKKTQLDRFAGLSWQDLEEWAGSKIVSRGKNYQRQGFVSELAQTDDGGLVAWVAGTERYATRVDMEQQKKSMQWGQYLQGLRQQHARKIRLIEILDGLEGIPIVRKRG